MRILWLGAFLAIFPFLTSGQSIPVSETIDQLSEGLLSDDEKDDLSRNLEFLAENPVSLNSPEINLLWEYGLISSYQLQSLERYRKSMKQILSVHELQTIPGFQVSDVHRLLPFVIVQPKQQTIASIHSSLDYAYRRGEIQVSMRRVLNKQAAYSPDADSTLAYAGSQWGIAINSKVQLSRTLSIGFTAEKDPGESMQWNAKQRGFDFTGGYVLFQNKRKTQTLIIGNYKAGFGQGLSFDNSYAAGFTIDRAYEIKKFNRGVKPYKGNDETNNLLGLAYSIKASNWGTSWFVSLFPRDGKFSITDSTLYLEQLYTGGLHRTSNELSRRKNIDELTAGGNLFYRYRNLQIGINFAHRSYHQWMHHFQAESYWHESELNPQKLLVLGSDYQFNWKRFHFFGEFSADAQWRFNQIHGLMIQPVNRLHLAFLFRQYEPDFVGIASSALGQFSGNTNEYAWYGSIRLDLNAYWNLQAYFDWLKNPWLAYRVNAPSHYEQSALKLQFNPDFPLMAYLQVRHKKYPLNPSVSDTYLFPVANEQTFIRLHASYYPSKTIRLQNRIEYTQVGESGNRPSSGLMIYQDLMWEIHPKLRVYGRMVWFDTDDFNSRLYALENDAFQVTASTMLYDEGSRTYALVQYSPYDWCKVSIKLSQTEYFYAESIGSGGEEIAGSKRYEWRMRLIIKL